jgi:hypothetical protein
MVGGGDEAVDCSRASAALVGAGEGPISSFRNRATCSNLDAAHFRYANEAFTFGGLEPGPS